MRSSGWLADPGVLVGSGSDPNFEMWSNPDPGSNLIGTSRF